MKSAILAKLSWINLFLRIYYPSSIHIFLPMAEAAMRPSLNGIRPDSDRSMRSNFSLSNFSFSSEDVMMLIDLRTGSSRSILSFELLPPHEEADDDRELDDERQCSDASVTGDEVERLPTRSYDDCPIVPLILELDLDDATEMTVHPSQVSDYDSELPYAPPETAQVYPTAVSFDEYQDIVEPAECLSSTPTKQESEVMNNRRSICAITLMNEIFKNSSGRWLQEIQQGVSDIVEPVAQAMVFPEPEPSAYTVEPTDNDILGGRGGFANNHPGNVHFRTVALELRPDYSQLLTKKEKKHFSIMFVERMKNENRRFLAQSSEDGLWHEMDDHCARKKASQLLREDKPQANETT